MESLRESLLRQELQRELQLAKKYEAEGRHNEASKQYLKASSIYRRIGMIAPRFKAEEAFSAASQYESVSKTVKQAPEIKKISLSNAFLLMEAFLSAAL